MTSTIGRVAAGVFTLGLSEVVGGLMQKPTAPSAEMKSPAKVDEGDTEAKAKLEERRRRQAIARSNRTVQTSPLGASITQGMLGGPTITGQ